MANPVQNVIVSNITENRFKLSFDQVLTSRDYVVYFDGVKSKEINKNNSILDSGRIKYIVTGVNGDVPINVVVKAIIGGQEQDLSSVVTVVPNLERQFFKETDISLIASATFTGIARDVSNYSIIKALAFSDQSGTLKIEQSGDGINWDLVDSIVVPVNTGTQLKIDSVVQYARVVYVNDATPQGLFRLYLTLDR